MDLKRNQRLGEVILTGIPYARKESEKEPIEVIFSYDMNGILQVRARVASTGKEVRAEISTAGVKAGEAPDLSKWDEAKGGKRFRPAIRKADKLISAGNEASEELKLLVRRIKEALVSEDDDKAEELRIELVDLMEEIN
jgi:molecular chaperone DnaK